MLYQESLQQPHEEILKFFSQTKSSLLNLETIKLIFDIRKTVKSLDNDKKGTFRTKIFEMVNGKINCDVDFTNKFEFIEFVNSIGYNTPKQVMLNSEETHINSFNEEKEKTFEKILDVVGENKKVICKPVHGSVGRGIHIFDLADENGKKTLKTFIEGLMKYRSEPYVFQEYLDLIKDYRYIFHRDQNNDLWKVCYEKVRPVFSGDGFSSLLKILLQQKNIPINSKATLIRKNISNLFHVYEEKENISLVKSGNISQGAYGSLVESDEFNNIDEVILPFIDRTEEVLGHEVSTLCFDLGLTEEKTKNFRENLYFFELQMPFGFSGYINAVNSYFKKEGNSYVSSFLKRKLLNYNIYKSGILGAINCYKKLH